MKKGSSRRRFLQQGAYGAAALAVLGCRSGREGEIVRGGAGPTTAREAPQSAPATTPASNLVATPECRETDDNIEGPYYRPGAPVRSALAEPDLAGVRLTVSGYVFGLGCTAPLVGALLDVWQANDEGRYDNDGSFGPVRKNRYLLRGKIYSDEEGFYRFTTIVPGRYLDGDQYRPAHIHVKASAGGYPELTTQLYFPEDPYNDIDPYIKRSLVMKVEDAPGGGQEARFDFVLTPEA